MNIFTWPKSLLVLIVRNDTQNLEPWNTNWCKHFEAMDLEGLPIVLGFGTSSKRAVGLLAVWQVKHWPVCSEILERLAHNDYDYCLANRGNNQGVESHCIDIGSIMYLMIIAQPSLAFSIYWFAMFVEISAIIFKQLTSLKIHVEYQPFWFNKWRIWWNNCFNSIFRCKLGRECRKTFVRGGLVVTSDAAVSYKSWNWKASFLSFTETEWPGLCTALKKNLVFAGLSKGFLLSASCRTRTSFVSTARAAFNLSLHQLYIEGQNVERVTQAERMQVPLVFHALDSIVVVNFSSMWGSCGEER